MVYIHRHIPPIHMDDRSSLSSGQSIHEVTRQFRDPNPLHRTRAERYPSEDRRRQIGKDTTHVYVSTYTGVGEVCVRNENVAVFPAICGVSTVNKRRRSSRERETHGNTLLEVSLFLQQKKQKEQVEELLLSSEFYHRMRRKKRRRGLPERPRQGGEKKEKRARRAGTGKTRSISF